MGHNVKPKATLIFFTAVPSCGRKTVAISYLVCFEAQVSAQVVAATLEAERHVATKEQREVEDRRATNKSNGRNIEQLKSRHCWICFLFSIFFSFAYSYVECFGRKSFFFFFQGGVCVCVFFFLTGAYSTCTRFVSYT